MSLKALKDYTFTAKYSNYIPEKKRRETWKEAVERVRNMMLQKYHHCPEVHQHINFAYDMMYQRKVLGSQRALQFGGEEILNKNMKIYNCLASYCDRPRFFQETMYLLLCGCGTGFSVQKHHVAKLPKLIKKEGSKKFVVADSIEGWADACGVLICSYFENDQLFPSFNGKNILFDFSKVRPEGAPVGKKGRKAPGPEPLKRSLIKIKEILDLAVTQNIHLSPIQCYDIVMHMSDAVLSGGIRRSATLCMFSHDDTDMLNAKTGNWYYDNPQRARSNNSALLLKDSTTFEDFAKIMESVKQFGEPGYIWSDSTEQLFNPCQPKWAKLLTPDGIRELKDVEIGDKIWSQEGWTTVVKKWSTGFKEVYKYTTTSHVFYGTENHRVLNKGEKIEVGDSDSIDRLIGYYSGPEEIEAQLVMDGLVIGDGCVHKASNNLMGLFIGDDDQDYFDSEIKDLIIAHRPGITNKFYTIKTTISHTELPKTFERYIPDRFLFSDSKTIKSFLRGLYSANGSVVSNRITLKASSFKIIEQVQMMLSSIGISSYWTKQKGKLTKFNNGEYQCKDSYDLNITNDREKFIESIGFIQKYKNDKIEIIKQRREPKFTYEIIEKELISVEEVFDITVDNHSHTYWTQGCNVSNCVEASFYPVTSYGESGWQMCNLSTINWGKIDNEEDFYEACKAASIIGTLQAGFDDVGYLTQASQDILRREALLGVSATGWLEKPNISLVPKIQRKGAKVVVETNQMIANIIGINPAARNTLVKPEGTSSSMLGTSSGIHPHNAKRYIRYVQVNKQESVYQYFKSQNPSACFASAWSANNTDDNIAFCIEVPNGSKTKNQIGAIELLEIVKTIQQNWVLPGKVEELCSQNWLTHNVSNTINVKEDEWDEVTKYIYKNRKFFAGISLLSVTGDKDYKQAPFTAIYLPSEMARYYGDWIVFVAGLIESGLNLFEDDLWSACDCLLNNIEAKGKAKAAWKERCIKFANNYVDGDIKRLTYAMKDVFNYKLWTDLNKEYKDVDYSQMVETENNTKHEQEAVCAGGQCTITF